MKTLLHAIDLALLGEWDEAKAILEREEGAVAERLFLLVKELEQRDYHRARTLSVIRHEIGNAVAIALANVEGILDGVLEPTLERLYGIHEALLTATRLLAELRKPLDRGAGASIAVETFNICALIAANVTAVAGLAEAKSVRIDFDPCGAEHRGCLHFRGDRVRIDQILRNVLINAVRYTPPGGSVRILCNQVAPDVLTLTISDTGPGLAAEDLPHIFAPGYRGRNAATPGEGIGLSVVKQFLDAIGGDVRVVSHEGTGATFAITIPALPLAPA